MAGEPMIKINGATTLGELAVLRAKLGVDHVAIAYDYTGHPLQSVRAVVNAGSFRVVGCGSTEAQAIDDALVRMWHRQAAAAAASEVPT